MNTLMIERPFEVAVVAVAQIAWCCNHAAGSAEGCEVFWRWLVSWGGAGLGASQPV